VVLIGWRKALCPGVSRHRPCRAVCAHSVVAGCEDWGLVAQFRTAVASAAPSGGGGVVSRRELFEWLERAGRVAEVSAPAGSGKTLLLRSWIRERGLADSAAWVSVQREERDTQRFWLSVLDALRGTAAASALVRELSAAPGLDVWALVERPPEDLGSLEDPTRSATSSTRRRSTRRSRNSRRSSTGTRRRPRHRAPERPHDSGARCHPN